MTTTVADLFAEHMNFWLQTTDIQICNYARRFIIKRGNKMVAKGNSLYVNGKGDAFIVGSFKAYRH